MPVRVWCRTIRQLRHEGFLQTCYCNDDPFSPRAIWGLHLHFLKALPLFNHHFLFRKKNISDFSKKRCDSCTLLSPYFPDQALCLKKQKISKFKYDAVFIGHWENDGRLEKLEFLARRGLRAQVHGSIWERKVLAKSPLRGPFRSTFGPKSWALYRESHGSLCFFSKLNNDCWTRRPLEIVAAGGLLICERTAEAQSHFTEDQEALYFSSAEELYQQVLRAKNNSSMARVMRERALARLKKGRYSLGDRVKDMMEIWDVKIKERREGVF